MQCLPQIKLHIKFKTDLLILYRDIMVDFTEINTKHTNWLCKENVKFLRIWVTCIIGFRELANYSMLLWAVPL